MVREAKRKKNQADGRGTDRDKLSSSSRDRSRSRLPRTAASPGKRLSSEMKNKQCKAFSGYDSAARRIKIKSGSNNNATVGELQNSKEAKLPLEVDLDGKVHDKIEFTTRSGAKWSGPEKCNLEKGVKRNRLKSVVIPVLNKSSKETAKSSSAEVRPGIADDIVVSVLASEDEFMSEDELDLDERIYPIEEETEPQPACSALVDDRQERQCGENRRFVTSQTETSVRLVDIQQIRNDPLFQEMVSQAVAEQMRCDRRDGNPNVRSPQEVVNAGICNSLVSERNNAMITREMVNEALNEIRAGEMRNANSNRVNVNKTPEKVLNNKPTVKSPSDTTIYAPAIARNVQNVGVVDQETVNKISDFVARMKLESSPMGGRTDNVKAQPQTMAPSQTLNEPSVIGDSANGDQAARDVAGQMILNAEKFRATVQKPSGMIGDGINAMQGVNLNILNENRNNEIFPRGTSKNSLSRGTKP